jgi:hypothetical protein
MAKSRKRGEIAPLILAAGQWSLLFYCRGDGFRREHLVNPRLMCLNSGICDLTLPGLDMPTRP